MKNNEYKKYIEKAKINIYNILAVLIVIIPEFIAEIIYTMEISQHKNKLAHEGEAWEYNTELKLSKMNIYELRLMAKNFCIYGYSCDDRKTLIKRIQTKSKIKSKRKLLNN